MLAKLIRATIVLASLSVGVYGLYTVAHTAQVIVEKNQPIFAFILIASMVFLGSGIFLLTEPLVQEKIQTKPGQVQ